MHGNHLVYICLLVYVHSYDLHIRLKPWYVWYMHIVNIVLKNNFVFLCFSLSSIDPLNRLLVGVFQYYIHNNILADTVSAMSYTSLEEEDYA